MPKIKNIIGEFIEVPFILYSGPDYDAKLQPSHTLSFLKKDKLQKNFHRYIFSHFCKYPAFYLFL